jgi:hypothetical protein
MGEKYAVFKVFYGTYDDIARDGDRPQERVTEAMPCQDALLRLEDFVPAGDYRFCVKPFGG